jgi:hypothetical protein
VLKVVMVVKLGSFIILPLLPDAVLKITTHLSPVTMGEDIISPVKVKVPMVAPLVVLMQVSLSLTTTTVYTTLGLFSI